MAKLNYKDLNDFIKNESKKYSKTQETSTNEKLQNQINNANTKLASEGLPTVDSDTRNGLEKFLGLTENQNFIGDVFELLGRPQQALFGGIKAGAEGEDILGSVWEHFKGDDYTSGKDLIKAVVGEENVTDRSNPEELVDAGFFDTLKYAVNNTDLVDIGGFALDVLLDPVDLPIAVFTGGTGAAVTGTADALRAANKTANVIDAAGDAAKVVSKVDNIADASKVAKVANTVDAVGDVSKAADALYSNAKVRKSISDLLFEGAYKGAKKVAGVADTGVESVLKHFDNVNGILYETPNAASKANLGKMFGESFDDAVRAVGEAGEKTGMFETYKGIKEGVSKAFDSAKSIPKKVLESVKKTDKQLADAAIQSEKVRTKYADNLNTTAEKMFKKLSKEDKKLYKSVEDYAKHLDNGVLDLYEYNNLEREITGFNLIGSAKEKKLTAKAAGTEGMDILESFADTVNKFDKGYELGVSVTDDGFVKLSGDWNKALKNEDFTSGITLKGNKDNPFSLSSKVKLNGNYSKADSKRIKELSKMLKTGEKQLSKGVKNTKEAMFAQLYKNSENVFSDLNNILKNNLGISPAEVIKGYVRHGRNDDIIQFLKRKNIEPNTFIKGSTSILGERDYPLSVAESNDIFRRNMKNYFEKLSDADKIELEKLAGNDGIFKQGMLNSIDDYLKNVPKNAADATNLNNILVNATFGDYNSISMLEQDILSAYKKGDRDLILKLKAQRAKMLDDSPVKILHSFDSGVPKGFKRLSNLDVNELSNKLKDFSDQYKVPELKNFADFIKKHKGKGKFSNITIQEDIVDLLRLTADKKEVNDFLNLIDKSLGWFKTWKVFSPTFQLNNFVGNTSNMYLAGITPTKMAKLYPEAVSVAKQGPKLYVEAVRNGTKGFSKEQLKIYDTWKDFIESGVVSVSGKTADDLYDIPESLRRSLNIKDVEKRNLIKKVTDINLKMNQDFDTVSRLVTFMEGKQNPSFLAKLGVTNAADAVRKVNFDPDMLSQWEKKYMKRLMPFYTFTKKNLAFQIDNLSRNGSLYHKLYKTYNSALNAATGGNSEDVAQYIKDNMYLPIPVRGEDGTYKVIRTTLPVGSLNDLTNDPMGLLINSLHPALRLPIELANNTNTFTGLPIESYAGEKSKNIPLISKKAEHILGATTGFDVPAKWVTRTLQGGSEVLENGGNVGQALDNSIGDMLLIEANTETDKTNKLYNQLAELEQTIASYEGQGYEFSTINELKQAQSSNEKARNEIEALYRKTKGVKKPNYYADTFLNDSTSVESEDLWKYFGIE